MAHMANTAADSFDGCWMTQDGMPVATIKGGIVWWANGPSAKIENENKNGFSVDLDGQGDGLRAHFTTDGKLVWSDGDVWKRIGEKPKGAEVAQKIGAAGGGAAYEGHGSWRGDGNIYFFPGKKYGGRREFNKDAFDQPADGGLMMLSAQTKMQDMYDGFDLNSAHWSLICQGWQNHWGALTPEAPEEVPRIRLLLNSVQRVVLIELFSIKTTNMMDPEMAADFDVAVSSLKEFMSHRSSYNDRCPLGLVYQGVGPHFCPGGNHHPLLLDNATVGYASTLTISRRFDQAYELNMPQFVCHHGAVVGGGAAQSLSSSSRIVESKMSLSFGNLSRGAVPIMNLSQNLKGIVGRNAAVSIYLSDDTFSAYTCQVGGWAMSLISGVPNLKMEGIKLAERFARDPAAKFVTRHHVPHDWDKVHDESLGFLMAFSTGTQFANVKLKEKTDPIEAIEDKKQPNNLTLNVPESKTVLDMMVSIENLWSVPVGDQALIADDGKALDDPSLIIEDDMQIQLKLTEQANAKVEWEAWNESVDDYEDYADDYEDYDYDEDDEEEE